MVLSKTGCETRRLGSRLVLHCIAPLGLLWSCLGLLKIVPAVVVGQVRPVAIVLGLVEFAIGNLLFWSRTRRVGLILGVATALGFTTMSLVGAPLGALSIDCQCFGPTLVVDARTKGAFVALLLVVSLFAQRYMWNLPTTASRTNDPLILIVLLAAASVGIGLAVSRIDHAPVNSPTMDSARRLVPVENAYVDAAESATVVPIRTQDLPTEATSTASAVEVEVVDESAVPLVGASVGFCTDQERLLESEFSLVKVTDSSGRARLQIPWTAAVNGWFVTRKEGYRSSVLHPVTTSQSQGPVAREAGSGLVQVVLDRERLLTIQVVDRRGMPQASALVALFGPWGRDAAALVDPPNLIVHSLYCEQSTDAGGMATVRVPAGDACWVRAMAPGFKSVEVRLSEADLERGHMEMTVNAIVIAGVRPPQVASEPFFSGYYLQHQSLDEALLGLAEVSLPADEEAGIKADAVRTTGLDDAIWLLAEEVDPRGYPARTTIVYSPFPGAAAWTGDVVYKRLADLTRHDVMTISIPPDSLRMGCLEVEFVNEHRHPILPADSDWCVATSGRTLHLASPLELRPDGRPTAARTSYVFDLPEGKYVIQPRLGTKLNPRFFDPVEAQVTEGSTTVIAIDVDTSRMAWLAIKVVLPDGRPLAYWTAQIKRQKGGVRTFGSTGVATSELTFAPGSYSVRGRAAKGGWSEYLPVDLMPEEHKELVLVVPIEVDPAEVDPATEDKRR